MSETQTFFQSFTEQLSEAIAKVLPGLQNDLGITSLAPEELGAKIAPIIEPLFEKFKLVSMQEFEAQTKLLQTLNQQIIELETRLETLEVK